jgi:ActR/RegA family two-component response regulator
MQPSLSSGRVLIVEPDIERSEQLREAIAAISTTTVCHDFVGARRILLATPPDLLVTNIFLGAYNGLHLVHLVAANHFPTKVVVYSSRHDAVLVAEARGAGAFVEDFSGLAEVLPSYLTSTPTFPDAPGAGGAAGESHPVTASEIKRSLWREPNNKIF